MKNITVIIATIAFASAAIAQTPAKESNYDKDARECNKQGEIAADEALKKTPMQNPADVTFIKQRAKQNKFNECMRLAGHTSGPMRVLGK